eukprot:14480246-Alexandrium_andersonii.AAC.1
MSASLVGSEMCIRDSAWIRWNCSFGRFGTSSSNSRKPEIMASECFCLLYTSDAADDMSV